MLRASNGFSVSITLPATGPLQFSISEQLERMAIHPHYVHSTCQLEHRHYYYKYISNIHDFLLDFEFFKFVKFFATFIRYLYFLLFELAGRSMTITYSQKLLEAQLDLWALVGACSWRSTSIPWFIVGH